MQRRTVRRLRAGILAVTASILACGQEFSSSNPTPSRELAGRVIAVGDGDSLTVAADGEEVRVRLARIDAPELFQPWGRESKAALSDLTLRETVRVEVSDTDRYGREVGEVYVAGLHVNAALVRDGHAWAFTRFAPALDVVALEADARDAGVGLWSLPETQRDPPWIWRRDHPRGQAEPKLPGAGAGSASSADRFRCGTKLHCSEMTSCEEARFYQAQCNARLLDGDGDGRPCERLCRGS